jgi:hypothetical protein
VASVNIRKHNGYYAVVYNFKTLDEAMQNVYRHFEGRDPPNGPVDPVTPPQPSPPVTPPVAAAQEPVIPTLEDTWVNIDTKHD